MKKLLVVVLVFALVFSFAACTQSSETQSSSDTASEQSDAVVVDTNATGRVGVSMPTKSSERWIRDGEGIKAGLEELGYEVDLQFAEDHVDVQVW